MPINKKAIWSDLEHHLHQQIRQLTHPMAEKDLRFVLLVSGGADSLALLRAFVRVLPAQGLGSAVEVVHFHHGSESVEKPVKAFRDESKRLVEMTCQSLGLHCQVIKNEAHGNLSEEEARDFRYSSLRTAYSGQTGVVFVLGHHQDDLLETRLLRLMRGTGIEGLVAMKTFSAPYFRPWLRRSRVELEAYLVALGQNWLVDPSQSDLRSWIRRELVPMLEGKQSGMVSAMARSLEQIADFAAQKSSELEEAFLGNGAISHPHFICLSREQQRQVLAKYMSSLGRQDYSRGQIDEIIKRLDKSTKVHTFQISGLDWMVNAEQIRALPALK